MGDAVRVSSAAGPETRREGETWLIEERRQLCGSEDGRQRVGGEANETRARVGERLGRVQAAKDWSSEASGYCGC